MNGSGGTLGEEEGYEEKGHEEGGGSSVECEEIRHQIKGFARQEGCCEKEGGEKNGVEKTDRFEAGSRKDGTGVAGVGRPGTEDYRKEIDARQTCCTRKEKW